MGTRVARGEATDLVGEVEVELTLLARHALRTTQRDPGRALDRSGYQLLGRLDHGPLSLRQLADAFGLDQSTVNRQVNALRRDGLVERTADPSGGTALLIRPTAHGRRALRHDRAVARAQVATVLESWSQSEISSLQQALRKFNTSIEELAGTPWPRD